MAIYMNPGAYTEEVDKLSPSVAAVQTAIPAFIGYTAKAESSVSADLRLKPKRISSMIEYELYFGLPQPEQNITVAVTATTVNGVRIEKAAAALDEADRSKHIMHYALQLFFANGGGPAFIVSVGPYKATIGAALVGTELHAGLDAVAKEDGPTLLVIPEAQNLGIADFKTLHDAALAQCAALQDRFVIMDVHGDTSSMADPAADLLTGIGNFRSNGIGSDHLKYGAAYAPDLETTLDFAYDASQTRVTITTDGVASAAVALNSLQASSNERYARAQAAIRDLACVLPPAGAVAGICAAVDADRGVWKAPANVSVAAVIAPTIRITTVEQDQLNVDPTAGKSVNAIRPFVGKGTLVWGARTLAGNDNEWRYINIRRFFLFVENSVKKASTQFVFEPNDTNTWVKVQGMIENFLTTLWRKGALQGVKPAHAFFVAIGLGKTMTAHDIVEGRMIVEIGMAAVRPAEFIILRFSQKMADSSSVRNPHRLANGVT